MAKYINKTEEVEALQWTGNNIREMFLFSIFKVHAESRQKRFASTIGDYIIKGENGNFYPCKPEIFEATHQPVA